MKVYSTGRPVTLKTAPIDPYDLLRGYSHDLEGYLGMLYLR